MKESGTTLSFFLVVLALFAVGAAVLVWSSGRSEFAGRGVAPALVEPPPPVGASTTGTLGSAGEATRGVEAWNDAPPAESPAARETPPHDHDLGRREHMEAIADAAAVARAELPRDRYASEENTIQVIRAYGPSVVAISLHHEPRTDSNLDPFAMPHGELGGGSGFVVNGEEQIVTNFHVVAPVLADTGLELQSGASITVSFMHDPDVQYAVTVVGANPDFDLALLEIAPDVRRPRVEPIPLGDSSLTEVGEKVIAIGNPFGLQSTVTTGIVSAIERERPGIVGIEIPYIQTDAAINPGNSGGPLLNSRGELIGINNAILAPTGTFAGIGFAVPSNLLRDSLEDMRAGGLSGLAAAAAELPDRPRLGITVDLSVDDLPPAVRLELGLPASGVLVTGVSPGGPADDAGLRGPIDTVMLGGIPLPIGMDVITSIEGTPVVSPIDVQREILERDGGDVVTLTVWRDGVERSVDVRLEIVTEP